MPRSLRLGLSLRFWLYGAATCLAISVAALRAQEPGDPNWLRLADAAAGEETLWGDTFIHGPWRIERHATESTYRLVDPQGQKLVTGTEAACLARFCELQAAGEVRPLGTEGVVLLHGLGRSRTSMQGLGKALSQAGYEVFNFGYASRAAEVATHAAALEKVLSQVDGPSKLHFVGHSLGNIVVRHWMRDSLEQRQRVDPRVGRFVMLGPPNQGAHLAQQLQSNPLAAPLLGSSGQQLGKHWPALQAKLCIPPCDFAILAGDQGVTPLLLGANDMCVTVEETRLAGASDFRVLPLNHGALRTDPRVSEYTLRFLREGCFESPEKRQPLPRADQ